MFLMVQRNIIYNLQNCYLWFPFKGKLLIQDPNKNIIYDSEFKKYYI